MTATSPDSSSHRLLPCTRLLAVVVLALPMAGHVHSHPTGTTYPSISTTFYPRQDTQPSTSSFNWWPYPSWGQWGQVSSSIATATPNAFPTVAVTPVPSDPNAVVASTTLSGDSSTSLYVLTTTTVASTSPTYTSAVSSASLIRITALPPATSDTSVIRARSQAAASEGSDGFNIAYLAPLFAVIGAIAGAACTWLLFRFLPIGGLSRSCESILVPGPQYTPPSLFRRPTLPSSASALVSAESQPRSSSGQALLRNDTVVGEKKGSWLGRAFSSRSKSSSAPTEQATDNPVGAGEEDPFLDASSDARTPIAHVAIERRDTSASAFSRQLVSPDPYGALSDGEGDVAAQDPARHKSVRRSILDCLKFGSLRRPKAEYERGQTDGDENDSEGSAARRSVKHRRGHKRADSDAVVDSASGNTPSRRPTVSRNRSQLVASPPGFRIVIEDPETGALLEEDAASCPPTPTPTKRRQGSDIYTPKPMRRSTEEKRSTPYSSPYSSPTKAETREAHCASPSSFLPAAGSAISIAPAVPPKTDRVDSSILPASPPMVMSPPLESQLFFGSTPSLNLQLPIQTSSDAKPASSIQCTHTTGEKPQYRKLQTHRAPPLLPFPSMASSSPFRGRLKRPAARSPKAQAHAVPLAARADSSSSSASSEAESSTSTSASPSASATRKVARGTPAERYHARQTALHKVDEIVSRSWSERGFPGSPNNFGNFEEGAGRGNGLQKVGVQVGDDHEDAREIALTGMGIEQRLEALSK